jgi:hypothetical protein
MKKLILSLSFIFCCTIASFSQINAGIGSTLIFDGSTFGLQAKGIINIESQWRIAGAFNYYLDSVVDFSVDADVQYELLTIGDNFNIFPLAGLNILNAIKTDIGINLGLFMDYRVGKKNLHIYTEPKILINDGSSFVLSAGFMF